MLYSELVKQVSDHTNYSRLSCSEIVKATFEVMARELEGHGSVIIPNFGKFEVITRKGRVFSMPKTPGTKEDHVIHEVSDWKYPKFTPYDHLKKIVK